MSKIITSLKKSVEGVDFATVANVFRDGFHTIPADDLKPGGRVEKFLSGRGLLGVHVIFLHRNVIDYKVHSGRIVHLYKASDAVYWHVVVNDDVYHLCCKSNIYDNNLVAEKQPNGNWTIALEVSLEKNGKPREGVYRNKFHEAVGPTVYKVFYDQRCDVQRDSMGKVMGVTEHALGCNGVLHVERISYLRIENGEVIGTEVLSTKKLELCNGSGCNWGTVGTTTFDFVCP